MRGSDTEILGTQYHGVIGRHWMTLVQALVLFEQIGLCAGSAANPVLLPPKMPLHPTAIAQAGAHRAMTAADVQ